MRTWLVIVMMVLLPLQLTWAATTAYCAHEKGLQASHVGHHTHRHAGVDERAAATDMGKMSTAKVDLDGGTCHASCPAALGKTPLVATLSAPPLIPDGNTHALPSAWDSRPDRPQWMALA